MRLVAQQRLDPFPMDVRRPFRLEYVARRQLKEDVADGRGVKDVGVETVTVNGREVARTLRRKEKIVDDDLPEIARRYRAFREEHPEPGA